MAHTPGPWKVTQLTNGRLAIVQVSGGFIPLASPFRADAFDPDPDKHADLSDTEADANARLIAAAPELLQACQEVETWLQGLAISGAEAVGSKLWAVIDKATKQEG